MLEFENLRSSVPVLMIDARALSEGLLAVGPVAVAASLQSENPA